MTHDHGDHLTVLLDRAADQVRVSPPPISRVLATQRRAHRRRMVTRLTVATVAAIIVIAGATTGNWIGDRGPGVRVVPAAPASTAPISTKLDGTWTVTAFAGSGPSASALPAYFQGRVKVTFDKGRLNGYTGCNWFTSSYEQSGGQGQDITFIGGGLTEVACQEDEPPLLDRLSAVRHVGGAGNTRYLLDDDDQIIFELTRT
jgi:heat shock protein HslJ